MSAILEVGKRDISSQQTSFAVTNITSDYALDCNANNDLSTADVLGTLIKELIQAGIIHGTIA
jgi:hypothetical protein